MQYVTHFYRSSVFGGLKNLVSQLKEQGYSELDVGRTEEEALSYENFQMTVVALNVIDKEYEFWDMKVANIPVPMSHFTFDQEFNGLISYPNSFHLAPDLIINYCSYVFDFISAINYPNLSINELLKNRDLERYEANEILREKNQILEYAIKVKTRTFPETPMLKSEVIEEEETGFKKWFGFKRNKW